MNGSDSSIDWNHIFSMTNTRLGPEEAVKNNSLLLPWIFKVRSNLSLSLSRAHTHTHWENKQTNKNLPSKEEIIFIPI